jgi:hypothetical protein
LKTARATGPLLLALGTAACSGTPLTINGACVVESNAELRCATGPDGGASAAATGLLAYSCTGAVRPDDAPTYIEGVPRGLVCADRALPGDGEARGYCCTAETTTCAYDPVADCAAPMFGYQCRGANRPESLNVAISCGQGVREGDLINYCCSGTPQPDGCVQSDSVLCSPRLEGWTCKDANMPLGEELGANRSRADSYRLLCPVPTPAGNPAYKNYCCYPPALVPEGGSCVQDTGVPGCQPGRFGFACYGPDTPEQDYLPMHCPERGVPGTSAEGYPATLYCCDFQ